MHFGCRVLEMHAISGKNCKWTESDVNQSGEIAEILLEIQVFQFSFLLVIIITNYFSMGSLGYDRISNVPQI